MLGCVGMAQNVELARIDRSMMKWLIKRKKETIKDKFTKCKEGKLAHLVD